MKILIIGSKGFIGSHAVSYFSIGHEVWQCDVVPDYTTSHYHQIDATNAHFDDIFRGQEFDVCINCSGAASVPDSLENPQRDFMLNVSNVFKQLDAIRKYAPSCKYINMSSAAVYGNPQHLPIDENHAVHPISPYGTHKRLSEIVCSEFYQNFGVSTSSLRIFSAYGPGLKKQLFWDLDQKAKTSNKVILYGTGKESRDFIFITDLIQAIEVVILRANFTGDVINVANGKEIRIEEAVKLFYQAAAHLVDIEFGGEERKGDPSNWVANIDYLRQLGYQPTVTIAEGLKLYAAWLDEEK